MPTSPQDPYLTPGFTVQQAYTPGTGTFFQPDGSVDLADLSPNALSGLNGTYAAYTLAGQEALRTVNDARLRYARARLAGAKRGKNTFVFAVVGDSKSEGQNSDAGATYQDVWTRYLLTALRAKYQPAGVTGGDGYVPFAYGVVAPTNQAASFTGVNNTDYTIGNGTTAGGLGGRVVRIRTTSATLTITRTCSSFTLHYFNAQSAGQTSKIDVAIDGGAATTITTGTTVTPATWASGALTPGSHTITVKKNAASAGDVWVNGIDFFNGDETSGVRYIDCAHYGYTTNDFANGSVATSWVPQLNLTAPDLVIVRLGTNDQANFTAAVYQTNMTTILNSLQAGLTKAPSYLLLHPESRNSGIVDTGGYPAYQAAAQALLSHATAPAFTDLGLRMPPNTATTANLGIYGSDGLHETSLGYQYVSDTVERVLITG